MNEELNAVFSNKENIQNDDEINQNLVDNISQNYPDTVIPLDRADGKKVLLFPISTEGSGAVAIYVTPEGAFRINSGSYTGADLVLPDELQKVVTENMAKIPPVQVQGLSSSWGHENFETRFHRPIDGLTFEVPCRISKYDFTGSGAEWHKRSFWESTLDPDSSMNKASARHVKSFQEHLPARLKYLKTRLEAAQATK